MDLLKPSWMWAMPGFLIRSLAWTKLAGVKPSLSQCIFNCSNVFNIGGIVMSLLTTYSTALQQYIGPFCFTLGCADMAQILSWHWAKGYCHAASGPPPQVVPPDQVWLPQMVRFAASGLPVFFVLNGLAFVHTRSGLFMHASQVHVLHEVSIHLVFTVASYSFSYGWRKPWQWRTS